MYRLLKRGQGGKLSTHGISVLGTVCTKKSSLFRYTLQRQFRLHIPFLGTARPQAQFPHSCVLSDLYIPRISLHISSSRTGRPIVGIYNSLIDTWMWKLGLRPRFSFSGNICFKFSAFCHCSVRTVRASNCGGVLKGDPLRVKKIQNQYVYGLKKPTKNSFLYVSKILHSIKSP